MKAAYKTFAALLVVALVAGTATAAPVCDGTVNITALPYSIGWTTTGSSTSTTFVQKVCNSGCDPLQMAYCRPIAALAISASPNATTIPTSEFRLCGPTFIGASLGDLATKLPSESEHCETFYYNVAKAGATVEDLCPGGCITKIRLDNNVTAAGIPPAPLLPVVPLPPPPSPMAYGRRRRRLTQHRGAKSTFSRQF